MSSSLHAQFLGGYRLQTASGRELNPPATHNARLLLAYLLLHPRRQHARAFLAGLFWPDHPESAARRRLNQALWRTRQTWDGFASNKESIALREDALFELDVAAFQTQTEAALQAEGDDKAEHWRQALAIYAGPLLPGYYDDWVLLLREQLHDHYLLALETCAAYDMQAGAYTQALLWAQRLVQTEPLQENAHRLIIQLHALLGQRQQAFDQYEILCQLLAEELHTVPTTATQELISQLRSASPAPQQSPVDIAPLFSLPDNTLPLAGREHAWQKVHHILAKLERRTGGVVTVLGEAGIGKSRFLAEIMAQAQWRNLHVWQAAAPESGRHSPYTLWIELLRPRHSALQVERWALDLDAVWLAALADLLPELRDGLPALPQLPALPAVAAQQRLQEAILRLLSVSTQQSPLVLLLDDLQWADIASLETLNHLLAGSRQSPVLFVLSYRDNDPATLRRLTNILDAAPTPPLQLHLQPLSADATGQLIRAALGLPHPTPRFEQRLYQATSGHPLFILETLHALYDQGILFRNTSGRWSTPWDESTADYTELPLTERLQEILLQRLEHLTPAAQTLFEAAAALNSSFRVSLMNQLSELSPTVTIAAIQELQQQRLLRSDGTRFRISHDLLRQTVCEMTEAEISQRLHGRIALALADDADIPAAVLADHFTQARAWEPALNHHRQAALQAQDLSSYAAALEHWHACIHIAEQLDLAPSERFDLRAAREHVLDILGQRQAQKEDIAAMLALAEPDPIRKSRVLRRQARLLNHLSQYAEAEAAARQALTLAREHHARAEEHTALLAWSHVLNWWGKVEDSLQPLETALQLATEEASLTLSAHTHQELGDALVGLGRHAEAVSHLQTALDLSRQLQDRRGEANALHLLAIITTEQGDLPGAHRFYQEELTLCQALGFVYGEARTLLNVGNLYYLESKAYQALQQYNAAIALFQTLQNRRGMALARLNRVSQHTALFGSAPADFADVEMTLAYAHDVDDAITVAQCQSLMGVCWAGQGDYETAETWLARGARALIEVGQLWMAAQDYRELARVQLKLERSDAALASLDKAEALFKEVGAHEPDPIMLALRGQVAYQHQELAQALDQTQRAIQIHSPGQEQEHLIYFWHAQALAAAGRSTAARTAIHQAHDSLQRLLQDFPPELRAQSLTQKPEHRQIMAAFATEMTIIEHRLPTVAAPTGRPLFEHEWCTIQWTVHHPDDERIQGKVRRRRHQLQRLLQEAEAQGAIPRLQDLARALEVSAKTIQRDLAALRAAGHDVSTRGSRE